MVNIKREPLILFVIVNRREDDSGGHMIVRLSGRIFGLGRAALAGVCALIVCNYPGDVSLNGR